MFDKLGKGLLDMWVNFTTPVDPSAARGPGAAPPGSARDQALAQIRANQARVVTPERAALIENAMRVHRAKQKILADLDDEQKQRLVALAMRALLNEGREPPAAEGKTAGKRGAKPSRAPAVAKKK